MAKPIYKRHVLKTITWRIIGTLDTLVISWVVTGNPVTGLKISGIELVTKMLLYFLHERLWFQIKLTHSKKRHLIKTFTYRILGTLDTMLIASIVSGNPKAGLSIGAIELVSKLFLYYFHERIWYRFNFGLSHRKRNLDE
ncbi:DUF2061 domain-containing protein [Gaetbulibacter saemankumensis]|uniref:DUF2061 domain-containing protein n=1 Tax=Gaetbulibacter saemankumensis TaxID=311208 RepID=UPI000419ADED|nr:DUF2061 domain-containing protein [Gaetbulibacter saemankumensis]